MTTIPSNRSPSLGSVECPGQVAASFRPGTVSPLSAGDAVGRVGPLSDFPVLASDLSNIHSWFPDDATAADRRIRALFDHAAKRHDAIAESYRSGARAEVGRFLADTDESGREYFMNHLYLPAPSGKAERTIIMDAGVHGAEGSTGEAAIELFIREKLDKMSPEERATTNILILHSVNAWGRAHGYRFTRRKHDLNRQGLAPTSVDRLRLELHGVDERYAFGSFPPSEFSAVARFMSANKPLTSIGRHKLEILAGMGLGIARVGYDGLIQAVGGGQYETRKGTVFGGEAPEAAVVRATELIVRAVTGVRELIHSSNHSGLGEEGTLHMIDNGRAPEDVAFAKQVLARNPATHDWIYTNSQTPGFYHVPGDFTRIAERALKQHGARGPNGERPRGAFFTVEWGTLGNGWRAKLETTQILTAMNRFYQQGATDPGIEREIRALGRKLFDPDPQADLESATTYRKAVVLRGLAQMSVFDGLEATLPRDRYGRFRDAEDSESVRRGLLE